MDVEIAELAATLSQPASAATVVAQAFPNIFCFRPVASWPAEFYPMGPGVDEGYDEGVRLATQARPNNLPFPFGYSQGAIRAPDAARYRLPDQRHCAPAHRELNL
jgi:hypothetical protein